MIEEWKEIIGFENYKISNLGNVINSNGRYMTKTWSDKTYYRVHLRNKGKNKTLSIHQLVAIAFLNHTPNGYDRVVDHIDNNPKNNNVKNLQIVSVRVNNQKDKNKLSTSSKYFGVHLNKRNKKWVARINNGKKRYSLGTFLTEEDAKEVYLKALDSINKIGDVDASLIKTKDSEGYKDSISTKKEVIQRDLNGLFIKKHTSIKEASKEIGVPASNISRAAKNNKRTSGGFKWSYD